MHKLSFLMKFSSKTIDAPELYTLFFALIVLQTWYSEFKAGSSTLIALVLIISIIYPKYQKELIISYKPYRPSIVIERILQEYAPMSRSFPFASKSLGALSTRNSKTTTRNFFVLPSQSILFLTILCGSTLNTSPCSMAF